MAITNTIRAYNSFILLVDAAPDIEGAIAGVGSIAITPNGNVYLKTGTNNLDWSLFSSPSPSNVQAVVEYRQLTLAEITDKSLSLTYIPTNSELVQLDVISGGPQNYLSDYSVTGQTLSWAGLDLETQLEVGNYVRLSYYKGV